jgi:hypothetical protein
MPDKLLWLLQSRKFWATIAAVAFLLVGTRAGVDQEALTKAVLTIIAYILGTALEDGLRGGNYS